MRFEIIFLIAWAVMMISLISLFLLKGKKSIEQFPSLEKTDFEYIENGASGYSTLSFLTKSGSAKRVLQIRVTKNELWLKTHPLFAWIADKLDLLHIIPINSITAVKLDGKKLILEFHKNDISRKIILINQGRNELIHLLHDKMSELEKSK